jgi:hypothetical protein
MGMGTLCRNYAGIFTTENTECTEKAADILTTDFTD